MSNSAELVSFRVVEATTLRERKKAATRQSLHEAALRLAVAHGLDNVTLEAIADEANVSRRTFSNYFTNKEDALLYGDRQRYQHMLDLVRNRPPGEGAWRALTSVASASYAGLADVDPVWLAQLRMIRRHPSVLAQQMAIQAAFERELAAEIAARSSGPGDALRDRVVAATFLATLRTATTLWIEDPASAPLAQTINRALGAAGEAFT